MKISLCLKVVAGVLSTLVAWTAASCSAQGEVLDADAIRRAGTKSRTYFHGKEIEYRIEVQDFPSPKGASFYTAYPEVTQKGIRKIAFGEPAPGRTYIPTRVMHFQDNPGEPHLDDDPLLTYFQGFDGRVTNTYVRNLLYDYEIKNRINSRGNQKVGCGVGAFTADPMVRLLVNHIEPFQGLPPREIPFVELNEKVKAERVEHAADENAIRISSTDPSIEQYTIVSSAPEQLILERGGWSADTPLDVEVAELARFDGARYPKRAVYRVLTPDGQHGWTAKIELIDVRDIDVDQFEWIPPWPKGTLWSREKDRKHFLVPYSREQLNKIRAAGLARARSDSSEGSSSFFTINVILLLAIITLLVYRFWPREETAS